MGAFPFYMYMIALIFADFKCFFTHLILAETEDIYITRNGKVVAKLSNPYQDRVDVAKSLFGVIPADMDLEETREERLNNI
ncbi:MAG: hypothetical protein NC417_12665 [Candidatus Gastranaerophilales bacterium]|nr:hypothetical protein [Candidatus Gastranaerophilales bacterium]